MVELPKMPSKSASAGLPDLPLMPKKKVDTVSSGEISSSAGKSEDKKEDFISSLSFLDAATYGRGSILKSGSGKKTEDLTPEEKEYARVERVKRDALDEVVRSNAFLPFAPGYMKNTAFAGGVSKLASSAAIALGAITEAAVNFADDIVNPKISLAASSGFGLEGFRQTDFDIAKAKEEYSKPRKKSSESVAGDLYNFGNVLNKLGDSYLRNSARSIGVKEENIGKGFTELIGQGENGDAFLNLGVQAFSQLPQVTALAATGGSATAVFGGSMALGTAASLGEEYDKDGDITASNAIKSIGKGIVEGVTETIFRTDIQAARQLGKSLFTLSGDATQEGLRALIKQEGKEAVKEALVRDTGQVFKKAFGGAFEEGIEEVLAATGSFVIDRLEDGKWNQKNFDQLLTDAADSFFIGAATGGFISGGSARMSMTPLTVAQQKKIEKFNEIANNEELSQDVRDIAKSKVDEIVKYSTDLAEKDYGLLARLPIAQRQEAFDILSKIKTIEDEKSELKDESLLEAAELTIDGYKTQVDSIIGTNETKLYQEFRDALKTATEKDNEAIMAFLGDNNILEQADEILALVSPKVANKEDIQDTVVNETTDKLYGLLELIDSSETLTPQQKIIASQPIDEEISKLEGYEFTAKYDTTETFTKETTRTTREVGRIERENARKTRVTADRFNGQYIRFTDENGNAINTIAKVDDSGTITLQEQPKLGKPAGKPIVVDSNFLEFQESKFDEDGNVVGALLLDTSNNSTIQISNPELAMDLAIKAKQDKLGPISDAIFEQAVTEVLTGQELETTKEYINKNKAKQAAQQAQTQETEAPQTDVPSSPVGLPSRRAYVVEDDVETKKGNKILNKIAPEIKRRIGNYVKALKATIPNSTVVLYDNKADMIEGLVNQGYSRQEATTAVNESDGLYAGSSNTIHIDVMRMDKTTLPHEIFHPLVARLAKENPEEFIALRKRITTVLSGSNIKELDAFAKLYADQGEAVEAEEFLAQLAGLVTSNKAKMERGTLMKLALAVKEFLKKVATKTNSKALENFANSIFTEQTKTDDLIKFFEGFGRSLRQGEAINVQGLNLPADGFLAPEGDLRQQKITSVKNIDVKEVRTLSRAGNRVSKGLSVSTKNGKKVVQEAEDLSLEYVKANAPELFIANSNIIANYPLVSVIVGKEKITTIEDAQKVYDAFSREIANNLEYLMDNFNENYKEVSTLWYDGANILAQGLSKQYKVTTEQVAGIMASLSPQKDWYQNVRLAEMVLMAHEANPVMSKQMVAKQQLIAKEGLKPSEKLLKKAEADYKKSRTKINKEKLDAAKEKYDTNLDNSNKVVNALSELIGKNMNDVPNEMKGYYTRLYHEVNTTKDYNILSPDGQVIGLAARNDGEKAKVAWGSYTEINKATAIYLDGSQENITRSLGEMHKIRNFYNNIIDPMSKDQDVTMDTHAIAAALLMPLSGNSKQVGENFGTGTKNSSPLGIKGLYYAYAEGYKLAANETNLLPRQVQSITWEAIRGLFPATFKNSKENVSTIDNIWNNYSTNKISIDEARNQIDEFAGGIKDPTWARPIQEGGTEDAQQGDVGRGVDGVGQGTVGESSGSGLRQQKIKEISIVEKAIKDESNKLKAQIIWQGSPYSFNKFNTEKIGTGTGARFGGWGLYFTLEKARAATYGDKLKNQDIRLGDTNIDKNDYRYNDLKKIFETTNSVIGIAKQLLKLSNESREKAIKTRDYEFNNKYKEAEEKYTKASFNRLDGIDVENSNTIIKEFEDKIERLDFGLFGDYMYNHRQYRSFAREVLSKGAKLNNSSAYLYEVSIADDLNLLDFDKKISQDIYDRILNQAIKENSKFLQGILKNKEANGRDFYFNVSQEPDYFDNEKELSLLMLNAEIDGNIMNSEKTRDVILFNSEAAKIVNKIRQKKSYPDAFEESRNEYLDKFKNTPKEVSRYLRKLLFERNINVKKALEDANLEFSLYTMYNKAGASMFGNLKFTEKFNEIYGDLSAEEIKLLDNFILLRRTVAIDTNFDNRKESRPEHPDHKNIDGTKTTTTKESALSMLEDYKDLLGSELYNKIYNSSDKYFKAFSDILKYKYENGLINKETYELYKDYNYSPRKFLQFMFGTSISEESKLTTNNFYQRGLALSKDELSNIQSGSTKGMFVDSAKLLHAAMIATEVRVASNLALKTLYNEGIPANLDFVKEVQYETYQDGTIKVNPDGSLKYAKTADEGFRIVTFKENGVVKAFQLREDLAKEYFDEELFDKNSKAYKFAQIASGSNILRNMATGMNLAFFVTNIPVDALSQVQFSGIHDGASVGAPGQFASAIAGTLVKSSQLLPLEFGFKNKAIEDLIYEYGKAGGLMMTLTEEYSSKDKFLGKIPKWLGSFGNASEMGSKLNAYEKVRNNEIKKYKEQNGKEPIGEDLAKIQTKAAYIARAAMDYHRGGLVTKWIDGFVPYLNVLSQATKITADYIVKNPKDFTNKITQMGIFVAGLTIYNLMVAGDDYDNDDNEQDLLTKIVVFSPFKDADGKRGKLEIGAPDMVKKFLNIFQSIGEGIYYQAILGEKQKTDEWKIAKRAQYLSTFDLKLPSNIPPALKAMVEYKYNLDLWRNQDITKQLGDVLPQDEGRFNPSVASFYKIIGSSTGMSPIRLQKASENFITQSNPLVGIGYSLMDKMVNNYANLPESQRSKYDKGSISDIPMAAFDKIAGRIYSKTDPTITYAKGKDIIDRINQTAGSKKQEIKAEIKMLVDKNAPAAELNKFLLKQDPMYVLAATEYRKMLLTQKTLNFPNNKGEYFDVMTAQNSEAKAQILYAHFPYLLEKGNEKLLADIVRLKLLPRNSMVYFNKYAKDKGIKE